MQASDDFPLETDHIHHLHNRHAPQRQARMSEIDVIRDVELGAQQLTYGMVCGFADGTA